MKHLAVIILLLAAVNSSSAAENNDGPLRVLRHGVVNDTVTDAVSPGGLVRTRSGDLLTTFVDQGDSAAGARCYFVRSTDEGQSWSEPFLVVEPSTPKEGVYTELFQLPNGDLLMAIIRITHTTTGPESVFGYRESTIELKRSHDNGQSFESFAFLDTPPNSLTSTVGNIYQLSNGDLILPAYCYTSQPRQHPGYQYGSGFYRSLDGGRQWGPLEVAFADPPAENETPQHFNEAAYAVRDDGLIVAYARVDVHKGGDYKQNKMWTCQSSDQGLTWTRPTETAIAGIYPVITRLPSGRFVMTCGVRDSNVMRRLTSVFTSDDAIHWNYEGHPYYSRTNGRPYNSATGGSQYIIPVGENQVYIVFYACDPTLPGRNRTYIDGGLLELSATPTP